MELTGLIAFDLFFGLIFGVVIYALYRHWKSRNNEDELFFLIRLFRSGRSTS